MRYITVEDLSFQYDRMILANKGDMNHENERTL